jgi:sulfatase maturation enzyme AslB (radical SAM superfamily)
MAKSEYIGKYIDHWYDDDKILLRCEWIFYCWKSCSRNRKENWRGEPIHPTSL